MYNATRSVHSFDATYQEVVSELHRHMGTATDTSPKNAFWLGRGTCNGRRTQVP